jgi:hypothetical protein
MESAIRSIFQKHSFSKKNTSFILRVIENYQRKTDLLPQLTKSQIQNKLKLLAETADELSKQLLDLSNYIVLEDPPDSLQWQLYSLRLLCKQANTYSDAGRPHKTAPLSFVVQMLIFIYEDETGEKYLFSDKPSGAGRERAIYNSKIHSFVEKILKCVAPDVDAMEALKAARREPLSLNWMREIKARIDETIQENPTEI